MKQVSTQIVLYNEDPDEEEALIVTSVEAGRKTFQIETNTGASIVMTIDELRVVLDTCIKMQESFK